MELQFSFAVYGENYFSLHSTESTVPSLDYCLIFHRDKININKYIDHYEVSTTE
jgi:hypothetical protein